jgi:hypothetical protein
MSLSEIWDQFFKSFMIFVGVGIVWLRFIEPLFADQKTSVTIMIIVAVVLSVGKFVTGLRQIQQNIKKAQIQIDATYAKHEEAG